MTERFNVRPRQALIRFFEPGLGREVQAGKFVFIRVRNTGGFWCYVNTVTLEWDLMQEIDAWGIAPCVVEMMERMEIRDIHFACKTEKMTYITDLPQLYRFGILTRFGDRGTHWHLPRKWWRWTKGLNDYPYVHEKRVLELSWLEPEVVGA